MIVLIGSLAGCQTQQEQPQAQAPQDAEPAGASSEASSEQAAGSGLSGSLVYWDRSEYVQTFAEMQKARLEQFGQDTGVSVEYISVAPADIKTKLFAAIEANDMPDLMAMDGSNITQFISTGKLLETTDFLDEFNFREDALNLTRTVEGQYAVPLYLVPNVLFMRKDKLDEKGLDVPENWEEVLEVARAINDPENNFYGAGFQLAPVSAGDCEGFTRSVMDGYGAILVDETGTVRVKDYADEIKQALAIIKAFYDEGLVPPSAITGDNAWNNEQYLAGTIGMTLNAGSIMTSAKQENPELAEKTAVTAYPGGPVNKIGSGGLMSFVIAKDGNVDAAKAFIKDYYYEEEYYNSLLESLLGLAVTTLDGQREQGMWATDEYRGWYDASMNMLTVGWPAPPDERASQLHSEAVLSAIVQEMIINDTDFDTVVDKIDQEYRRVYQQ